jgi:hypothetical protein
MLVQCVHEFLHVCRKITPITISQIIKSDIYRRHQNHKSVCGAFESMHQNLETVAHM